MTFWEVGNARRVLVADVIVPQDYVRLSIDNDAVELYRHVIKNPSQHLPPIIVGTDRTLHDGRHRLEAYRLEDVSMIEAVVELALEPKYRVLREFELNFTNAVRLTAKDRQHAMAILVMNGCTVKEIAAQTPYSEQTVSRLTAEARAKKRAALVDFIMQLYDTGKHTQKEIATKAGVSESTVSRIIAEFQHNHDDKNEILDEDNDEDSTIDDDADLEQETTEDNDSEEEPSNAKVTNIALAIANEACSTLIEWAEVLEVKYATNVTSLSKLARSIETLERLLPKLKHSTIAAIEARKNGTSSGAVQEDMLLHL